MSERKRISGWGAPPMFGYLFVGMRPSFDGPVNWLWFVGAGRILVFVVVAVGAHVTEKSVGFNPLLLGIYAGALASDLWYLYVLRREGSISAVLTWTQVLVDFSVVSATIGFTGGHASLFTFLLVIVILEAGVLLGLPQGFVFATLATLLMFVQTLPATALVVNPLLQWYNFLIQGIAFYFTAFISGYWHQRVSRMKQFQRDILDNMNSGFLITDDNGIVIAMNKAACRILHLDEGNVIGRHVDGILRSDTGAECPITTALRSGRDFTSYEFYVRTDEEDSLLLGLTTNRIRDSREKETAIIASFIDLTDMSRMRQELQQHDRLAVVGELAAGLAHEIRNPVAAIRGAMEEIRHSGDTSPMAQRLADIAVRESEHLNEIVSAFLDFARDPSRRFEQVELGDILREVCDQLARKYGHADELHIGLSAPDSPCHVLGNATQIRQVFANIAQNAVEAMHEKGSLSITLNPTRGPIEIRFDDEGPGISPDKVARIFEPFYTEKERGVGMGLAICHRIVTAHNGAIQVASRPGGGTSMSVRLPVATAGE